MNLRFTILCNQILSLWIHRALSRGILAYYYHPCFTNLKVWYIEAHSEPYKTSKMERFWEIRQGFQLLTIFAKCSILDVLQNSEYTSGYTGFSLEAPWLFTLVAWPAHPHIDGVIIFVFWFYLFHTPVYIYGTQNGVTKLGQGRRTSHLWVPFLANESLPLQFLVIRPWCQVL